MKTDIKSKLTTNSPLSANLSVGTFTIAQPTNYSILTIYSPNIDPIQHASQEILKISQDGEIFYRHNGEIIKVNCPDDVSEAFMCTVFNLTNQTPEDVMIEKYIQKILNHERSNEYMIKLETTFRKLKLQKLKNSQL